MGVVVARTGIKKSVGIDAAAEAEVGIAIGTGTGIVGARGIGLARGLEVEVGIGIGGEGAETEALTDMGEGGAVATEIGIGTTEMAGEERGRLQFLNTIGSLEVPPGPHLILMCNQCQGLNRQQLVWLAEQQQVFMGEGVEVVTHRQVPENKGLTLHQAPDMLVGYTWATFPREPGIAR